MKIRLLRHPAALIILALCAAPACAETLTLAECISTAMERNPNLTAYSEKVAASRAGIGQAAASGNLQMSAGSSYKRFGSGLTDKNNGGTYSTSIRAEQSISDWGRRKARVAGAKLSAEAAEDDLEAQRDSIIQEVCNAYYGLNRATREREVALTRRENYEKRLTWARSFYEVGTKPKIEVTKAEADFASSRLAVVKAESSIAQFRARLANAMGEPARDIKEVKDELDFKEWDISLDEAMRRAQENRPELAAKRKRVEVAKTNLTLQMKGLSPSLSASAGYGFGGASPFERGEWNAGLSLSVPITDGGLTKSNIEQSEANLRAAEAELAALSNNITLEVRQAWVALREAKEALFSTEGAVRSVKATLDLAQGRYEAGVGDNLEISDAVEAYASVSANKVLALYNCKAAHINLEKAMGGLNYGE